MSTQNSSTLSDNVWLHFDEILYEQLFGGFIFCRGQAAPSVGGREGEEATNQNLIRHLLWHFSAAEVVVPLRMNSLCQKMSVEVFHFCFSHPSKHF